VQKWLKGNEVWAFVLLEQVVPKKEEVKGQLAALLRILGFIRSACSLTSQKGV
jgi:hypothetical protein